MDALGKLLRTVMGDNVKAEDCQEMFNVSQATAQSPIFPDLCSLHRERESSLTHLNTR